MKTAMQITGALGVLVVVGMGLHGYGDPTLGVVLIGGGVILALLAEDDPPSPPEDPRPNEIKKWNRL